MFHVVSCSIHTTPSTILIISCLIRHFKVFNERYTLQCFINLGSPVFTVSCIFYSRRSHVLHTQSDNDLSTVVILFYLHGSRIMLRFHVWHEMWLVLKVSDTRIPYLITSVMSLSSTLDNLLSPLSTSAVMGSLSYIIDGQFPLPTNSISHHRPTWWM